MFLLKYFAQFFMMLCCYFASIGLVYANETILPNQSDDAEMRQYFPRQMSIGSSDQGITIMIGRTISDAQAIRAYRILQFYINQDPLGRLSKQMADEGAVLLLVDGADGDEQVPDHLLMGQPLYHDEMPLAGSFAYLNNDWAYRDAAFEEILHLVHDFGIGTQYSQGVMPLLSKSIDDATHSALNNQLWGLGEEDVKGWLVELTDEGSLSQEYFASVVDAYYGLWGAFDEAEGSMWGVYAPKTRSDIAKLDPKGWKMVQSFLSQYLEYFVPLDPSFTGEFQLNYTPELPYTHKSQYIRKLQVMGAGDTRIIGNDADNVFVGGAGDNEWFGGAGVDTVLFAGKKSDYQITKQVTTTIVDGRAGFAQGYKQGLDHLHSIERLIFADQEVTLN